MTINNTQYGSGVLSDISISSSIGSFGLKGVATACLTFKLYDTSLGETLDMPQGTEIVFNVDGSTILFAYAETATKSGRTWSVTAYDACHALDQQYDMSGKTQYQVDPQTQEEDKALPRWYPIANDVVSSISNQCGFTGSYFSPQRQYKSSTDRPSSQATGAFLCYNDLNGKTCRQILDDISAAECGFFICTVGSALNFARFAPPRTGTLLDESSCRNITILGGRQIQGVYATDGISGEERATAGISAYARADISGRYMNAYNFDSGQQTASAQVMDNGYWTMYGWSAEVIDTYLSTIGLAYELGSTVTDGNGHILRVTDRRVSFGASIKYSLSAPKPETVKYMTKAERERSQGIYRGTISGDAVMISRSGGMEAVPNKTAEKAAPVSGGGA